MAVDFFFKPPTCEIPPFGGLQFYWSEIPSAEIRQMIIAEHQYWRFHRFMLDHLWYTAAGAVNVRSWEQPLGLSVRAGAIKALLLLTGAIIEAALAAHADTRGYRLPPETHRRTFGKILEAWRLNGEPHPDVASIWGDLRKLQSHRNHVHLSRAAEEPEARWQYLTDNEGELVALCDRLVEHVAGLQSESPNPSPA